jgi:hypothetical protein
MIEVEWVACTDPTKILEFLRWVSDRKWRLFVCGCCHRIWSSFVDHRSRRGIEVAERYADGEATLDELDTAGDSARQAAEEAPWDVSRSAAWVTTWRDISSGGSSDSEDESGIARVIHFTAWERGRGREGLHMRSPQNTTLK